MRILLGYHHYIYPIDVSVRVEQWLARLRGAGIDVHPFKLTLRAPGPLLVWPDLDASWKAGTPGLLRMYEDLARKAEDYDVFVNWSGINLHPDFVRQLPTFNVYVSGDDPESSELISKPVAASYDLAMVNNIAEVETYRTWGVKDARFWPLGFFAEDYDPSLTRERILNEDRPVDLGLLCERDTGWRRARLDRFAAAFPQGAFYGSGWPSGFLPDDKRVELYQRMKIGPNFHNSTGPINFRTYMLPANGVMQICDNRSHLGGIFELGREVVGFETLEECMDLCSYYLQHDDERRQIAANGWERSVRDYNEVAVMKRLVEVVRERLSAQPVDTSKRIGVEVVHRQRRRTGALAELWINGRMDAIRYYRGLVRRAKKALRL